MGSTIFTSPKQYYGVFVDRTESASSSLESKDENNVFHDIKMVSQILKTYPTARFKTFSTESEALKFSRDGSTSENTLNKTLNSSFSNTNKSEGEEQVNMYKTPIPQEYVKLRKAIEKGDEKYFLQHVWSNPKYLIRNAINATILHEGSRYNALHIAAKSKQANMFATIIDTIEDVQLMLKLFPEDSKETNDERIKFLLDNYLNTPDKGACETPLHFASKLGCLEIVELLSSHPSCVRNKVNKYDQKPCDIICGRVSNASDTLIDSIKNVLNSEFYIPLLRSENNIIQPVIGKPFSPHQQNKVTEAEKLTPNQSPINPLLSVAAQVGPMSPEQAESVFRKWKITSPRDNMSPKPHHGFSPLAKLRIVDMDKGYERIGRDIAKHERVLWTEYWPFLDCYCDLSTEEGLHKVENHLKKRYDEYQVQLNQRLNGSSSSNDNTFTADTTIGVSSLCERFGDLCIENESDISIGLNDPDNITQINEQYFANSQAINRRIDFSEENPEEDLCSEMVDDDEFSVVAVEISGAIIKIARQALNFEPENTMETIINEISFPLDKLSLRLSKKSVYDAGSVHQSIAKHIFMNSKKKFERNDLIVLHNSITEAECGNNPAVERFLCIIRMLNEMLVCGEVSSCCDCSSFSRIQLTPSFDVNMNDNISDDSSEFELNFVTPPSSIDSRSSSPRLYTPENFPDIFVNGEMPSKYDADALRALEDIAIPEQDFPHITCWMKSMEEFSTKEMEGWKTPQVKNRFRDLNSNENNSILVLSPIIRRKPRSKPSSPIVNL